MPREYKDQNYDNYLNLLYKKYFSAQLKIQKNNRNAQIYEHK